MRETWIQSPGLERSPGEGIGNPLQYSCLENSMNAGAWWATVHGAAKSRTQLSDVTFTFLSLSWTLGCKYLFELEFSPDIYVGMGFLNRTVTIFSFLGNSILLSIVVVPIYIPTSNVKVSFFSIASPAFIICRLFDDDHLDSRKWYSIVVLICIFLTLSNSECPFICLLDIGMPSSDKCIFRSSVHFNWTFFYIELYKLFAYFGN